MTWICCAGGLPPMPAQPASASAATSSAARRVKRIEVMACSSCDAAEPHWPVTAVEAAPIPSSGEIHLGGNLGPSTGFHPCVDAPGVVHHLAHRRVEAEDAVGLSLI